MPLSHEPTRSKMLAEIEIESLTRAELLCSLCYEIPCNSEFVAEVAEKFLDGIYCAEIPKVVNSLRTITVQWFWNPDKKDYSDHHAKSL